MYITDTIVSIVKVRSINKGIEKVKDLGDAILYKFEELKNIKDKATDKINEIEQKIEDLRKKQELLKVKIYKRANRLKKAFPTMQAENISKFLRDKIDLQRLKNISRKNKKN